MSGWFGKRTSEVPELTTSEELTHELGSPPRKVRQASVEPAGSPIAAKVQHSHHSPLKKPTFNTQDHHTPLFSPHKRRKYGFDRRRKMSMDDDKDPWFLIKFVREAMGHQQYRGSTKLPPAMDSKPTLVLDLDETLVHCCTSPLPDPDTIFDVNFSGVLYKVHSKFRPHMKTFLKTMAEHYELVIFTASQPAYANQILDIIDEEGSISYRLFRQDCTEVCGNYLKDLTCLGRDLRRTIIVDNSPQTFAYQICNGIPITSWYDNPEDDELLRLRDLLLEIKDQKDFRIQMNKEFQLEKLIDELDEAEYLSFLGDCVD